MYYDKLQTNVDSTKQLIIKLNNEYINKHHITYIKIASDRSERGGVVNTTFSSKNNRESP